MLGQTNFLDFLFSFEKNMEDIRQSFFGLGAGFYLFIYLSLVNRLPLLGEEKAHSAKQPLNKNTLLSLGPISRLNGRTDKVNQLELRARKIFIYVGNWKIID
jgi:hypothetical protein